MLPELSDLQFAVLDCIGTNHVKGAELRAALSAKKLSKTTSAFYQLMARLEEAGLVDGNTETTLMEGFAIKERTYWVTGHGKKAMAEKLAFYRDSSFAAFGGMSPA